MNTIRIMGDDVLHQPCNTVDNVDDVKDVIRELWDMVDEADGLGLSANQIGYNVRVAVIHNTKDDVFFAIINPEIIETYGDVEELHEGCLSLPMVNGNVERYTSLKLRYTDVHGNIVEEVFEGRDAHIIQHEVDHLNGIMYIDHYGSIRKQSMIKKFKSRMKKHLTKR